MAQPAASAGHGLTQQQLETQQTVGCTEMQGYLFRHARPAEEIVRLFLSQGKRHAGAA